MFEEMKDELKDRKLSSLLYMSPEKVLDKKCSKASDIWSLGIILMTYATNVCPYPVSSNWLLSEAIQKGPSKYALLHFPDDFQDFISKCIAFKEDERETADNLLNHPFITNFLSRCVEDGLDPSRLRHFTLYETKEDREKVLAYILDLNIKLEMDRHIEKLRSTDLNEEIGSLRVLTKTQLVWLATQLYLDTNNVLDIYAEKMREVNSSIDSTFGRFRKMKLRESVKSGNMELDLGDDDETVRFSKKGILNSGNTNTNTNTNTNANANT